MRKIPQNTSFFTFYNANPEGKFTTDCVIRALSTLPDQNWYKVFDELYGIARNKACTPSSEEAWHQWLTDHGYVRCPMPRKENGRLYTLREFVRSDYIKDGETVLATTAGHITCIRDRKILDTWNCAGYKVRRYYKKVNPEWLVDTI